MTEDSEPRRPDDPVGRLLLRWTRALAVCGGVLLCLLGLTTVTMIVMVQIIGVPFVGEVELISFGLVLTVYLFLPYCQMVRGHVIVDVFTARLPARLQVALDALWSVLFAGLWLLLIWRMAVGMDEMIVREQTTAALDIAYWWSFPLALGCFALLVPVCLYTAWRQIGGRDR